MNLQGIGSFHATGHCFYFLKTKPLVCYAYLSFGKTVQAVDYCIQIIAEISPKNFLWYQMNLYMNKLP